MGRKAIKKKKSHKKRKEVDTYLQIVDERSWLNLQSALKHDPVERKNLHTTPFLGVVGRPGLRASACGDRVVALLPETTVIPSCPMPLAGVELRSPSYPPLLL